MRPTKHVTHSTKSAQEVFDISVARHVLWRKYIPLVTTSEEEAITLFVWNNLAGRWQDFRIDHAPIRVARRGTGASNAWNWSRHVGLTGVQQKIYVVYKRAGVAGLDGDQTAARLILDTFQIEPSGVITQVERFPVPMPTYRVNDSNLATASKTPGFELWAGVDEGRNQLLIVTQALRRGGTADADRCILTLMSGDLDRLNAAEAWSYREIDSGGYGLDVRHQGDKVFFAYRQTARALKVPNPFAPGFLPNDGSRVTTDASVDSDRFFTPLKLTTLDLSTNQTERRELPGGEHPRIHNVYPLMVTVDRPSLRITWAINPAFESEPIVDWRARSIDKLTFVFDDLQQHVARGILLSISQPNHRTFPRTAAPWFKAQDLFEPTAGTPGIGWASTWPRFPLEPLGMSLDEADKSLLFDFLHKTPYVALNRSRARLKTDFSNGVLTVDDLKTDVYDINHGQINRPDLLKPDTTADNQQFEPFKRLRQQEDTMQLQSYLSDNTIGGSLVNDRDGVPHQFIAYTDLGDGGLRVVFDGELPPPTEPTPIAKDSLEPESVPGPGSNDERWIELTASDFEDALLPPVVIGEFFGWPTLTSQVHFDVELLLMGGRTFMGLTMDAEGWSEAQVNSIQTEINTFREESDRRYADDDIEPRAFINILPAAVVIGNTVTWQAGIEGQTVAAVSWTFTRDGSTASSTFTVNPVDFAPPSSGNWTVDALITLADGTTRTVSTVVWVEDTYFNLVSAMHHPLTANLIEGPASAVGNCHIGTATFKFLQYEITFEVDEHNISADRVIINQLDTTKAQWRFKKNVNEQGVIEYRLPIRLDTQDVRLVGTLASLTKIESVGVEFYYGRSFTPAILMNDTRTEDLLESPAAVLEPPVRNLPRAASSITARPFGNAQVTVTKNMIDVKVSMLPQAAVAAVVTFLIGLGATAAAAALVALIAMMTSAAAAAAAPLAGLAALAILIAATVAVFLFVNFVVPLIVSGFIADHIQAKLKSSEFLEELESAHLLQFSGEGVGLAIARQAINKANESGASLDQPFVDFTFVGKDRFRQNLFQMIHVCEGRCRVLIRT